MMQPSLFAAALLAASSVLSVRPAAAGHWYRAPAVSPDGRTVVFTAHGNLWRTPMAGGTAVALTAGDAWEGHPVWSRDGARLAYASDRFGDLDVFVLTVASGETTRLTHHDADDVPLDFSPDGARVLFSSARVDTATSSYFPTKALPELYEVPVEGGPPRMVLTVPASEARWSPDGARLAYVDEKAYENRWRQRDTSAFARDVWIHDTESGRHTKLTRNPGGDHSPVWSTDGGALYMQSELDGGSFNVRRVTLDGASTTLTAHAPHPARGLSSSRDGLLVYSLHGELYRVREGQPPRRIEVELPTARLVDPPTPRPVAGAVREMAVSPDGREVAFVARGEIFVTDAEFSDTVRITDTPEQERSVGFAPDGRALIYAAERGGRWALYETALVDDDEPRFSAATAWKERLLYAVEGGDAFQPLVSPDGEEVAFLENRDAIRVVGRDGEDARTVFAADRNYSYADGDIHFAWSPDARWIAASFVARGYYFYTDVGLAPADGSGPPRDISLSGYADRRPAWHPSGDVVYWFSDRYGERSHGSWGSEEDVVAAFLNEAAWTRFGLTPQERAILEAREAEEKKREADDPDAEDGDGPEGEDDGPSEDAGAAKGDVRAFLGLPPKPEAVEGEAPPPLVIDFDAVEDRTRRLTLHAADLADAVLSPDQMTLYYLAAFEKGYDLWRRDFREDETRKLASLGAEEASLAMAEDGQTLFILSDGKLMRAKLGKTVKPEPVKVAGEMVLRADAQRAHVFEHVGRQVQDKFYDPDLHGVDWPAMRAAYAPKVAAVSHNRDFAILVSEMLGRLNASHTGMSYRPEDRPGADATGALGAIFDLDGSTGLRIAEILPNGPLDRAVFDVAPGDRIIAIDGAPLGPEANPFARLNLTAGDRVRLTLARTGRAEDEVIRVRAQSRREQAQQLYDRWIDRRRAIVERLSEGRVGYLHIRSMNDAGFRQTFSELFGRNFDKEAVVVDTRFNGGGWLHDDLLTLLSGKPYFAVRVRGRTYRGAPEERWTKPTAVVMNEGNYSNAHMFPWAYARFDLGPLIGMPVPGTGTAVWWERVVSGDLVFGIPQVGILDDEGRPLENQQLEPDLRVDNPPADAALGFDRPLEAAVDALLKTLDAP